MYTTHTHTHTHTTTLSPAVVRFSCALGVGMQNVKCWRILCAQRPNSSCKQLFSPFALSPHEIVAARPADGKRRNRVREESSRLERKRIVARTCLVQILMLAVSGRITLRCFICRDLRSLSRKFQVPKSHDQGMFQACEISKPVSLFQKRTVQVTEGMQFSTTISNTVAVRGASRHDTIYW